MIYPPIYVDRDSFLHFLDPRVKILGTLLGIVAIMLYNDPLVLTALFILTFAVGRALGKIGGVGGEMLHLLKPPRPNSHHNPRPLANNLQTAAPGGAPLRRLILHAPPDLRPADVPPPHDHEPA